MIDANDYYFIRYFFKQQSWVWRRWSLAAYVGHVFNLTSDQSIFVIWTHVAMVVMEKSYLT